MKEFTYIIKDALGIHARPAGQVVKMAQGFGCDVKIEARDKSVDAKRIMGVMGLGAKQGDDVRVTCDGADEDAAIVALEEFFKDHL